MAYNMKRHEVLILVVVEFDLTNDVMVYFAGMSVLILVVVEFDLT